MEIVVHSMSHEFSLSIKVSKEVVPFKQAFPNLGM